MNRPRVCSDIEPEIVASATGDSDPVTDERVQRHIGRCAPCADEYQRYRAVEGVVTAMRRAPAPVADTATVSLSAHVPAPGIGESPTRPAS